MRCLHEVIDFFRVFGNVVARFGIGGRGRIRSWSWLRNRLFGGGALVVFFHKMNILISAIIRFDKILCPGAFSGRSGDGGVYTPSIP
jgi:hypothetical protein